MSSFLRLDELGYTTIGMCLQWDANLISLILIGNLLSCFAFIWMPINVIWVTLKWPNVRFDQNKFIIIRIIFIIVCFLSFLFYVWNILILFYPLYKSLAIINISFGATFILCAVMLQSIINGHRKTVRSAMA